MAKEDGNEVGKVEGEYSGPKAKEAIEHYDRVLAPKQAQLDKIKGEMSEPWTHNRDHYNMPKRAMKIILSLRKIDDDAKKQHEVDAIFDALAAEGHERSKDLLTMAQDGSDLPPALQDDDEEFEASEEELAQQKPRADAKDKKKAAGTVDEVVAANKGKAPDKQPEAVH